MTGTTPAVMPLISLGAPAFANSNQAAAARAADWLHTNSWRSTTVTYDGNGHPTGGLISPSNPVWVAYDLSALPPAERQTDLAVIHSPQYEYDYGVIAGPLYDMPLTYVLQINSAPGGGPPPTSGWQTVATVNDTLLHSHQHVFSMGGANWVRVDVTGAGNQNWHADAQLALDVYDASGGTDDDFIMFGDSITANAMNWGTISNSAGTVTDQELGVLLHDQVPAHYPAYEAGGIPYLTAGSALTSIDRWLALFPGKFVGLAYGTNDADGCAAPGAFYNNYAMLVQKVLAAGKIPLVPYFPWNPMFTPSCGQALHDQITALYQAYPQIIHGPDLWTYFKNHPDQIENYPSLGIHPNADGNMALREMWRNALLQAIYHVTPVGQA
jgi:lysophospholipase L1-like esterase